MDLCKSGWSYDVRLSTCYKLFTDKSDYATWDDAETRCRSDGGHLYSFQDLDEWNQTIVGNVCVYSRSIRYLNSKVVTLEYYY